MENKLRQRYWVLISKKGAPVLSSLIARENSPKYGEWVEVNLRPCCTVSTAIGTPSGTKTTITIKSGTEKLADLQVTATAAATVVSLLNSTFPAIGTFTQDGKNFYLKSTVAPNLSITKAYS